MRQIPASVLFISHEPCLGTITYPNDFLVRENRAWVIASCEISPGARPMHSDWPRRDREQCRAAGVPFWFAHWGEFCPELLMAAPDTFWDQPGKKEWGALDDEGNYFSPPRGMATRVRIRILRNIRFTGLEERQPAAFLTCWPGRRCRDERRIPLCIA